MNILILAENYPHPSHPETQAFIHSRNVFYKMQGLEFMVISFRTAEPYVIDGIKVYPPSWIKSLEAVDLCISHAPNLRNHFRFLKKNLFKIKQVLLIFHGYEALYTKDRSVAPNRILSKQFARYVANTLYDLAKLPLLKRAIKNLKSQKPVHSIVVSESLLQDMKVDMSCTEEFFKPFNIINNPINSIFNEKSYKYLGDEDIVCIRSLDDKKYGADLFVELARKNPQRRFHLYGKGSSFDGIVLPKNLKIIKKFFRAEEISELLNKYKVGVLFTRWDSQGILACEFAAYGIPLMTSDLPICREMLKDYPNVVYVPNDLNFDLEQELLKIKPAEQKVVRFTYRETTQKELNLIQELLRE